MEKRPHRPKSLPQTKKSAIKTVIKNQRRRLFISSSSCIQCCTWSLSSSCREAARASAGREGWLRGRCCRNLDKKRKTLHIHLANSFDGWEINTFSFRLLLLEEKHWCFFALSRDYFLCWDVFLSPSCTPEISNPGGLKTEKTVLYESRAKKHPRVFSGHRQFISLFG